jgi:hypothetical protein
MIDDPNNELDEQIRAAARDYNRPPGAAPRDRMWERIQLQRDASRLAGVRSARTIAARWWPRAIAVAALLVFGVLAGRLYERWASTGSRGSGSAPSVATRGGDSASQSTSPPTTPSEAPRRDSTEAAVEPRSPNGSRGAGERLAARSSPEDLAYRLAVVQHVAGADAMLTSFRTAAKKGEVDAQITAWARDLLASTRLLQASAVSQDPTMKRLLGDLELVLVQIAQYTTKGDSSRRAEELDLIEHSIERRGVMTKLRTTIPARLTPAGT